MNRPKYVKEQITEALEDAIDNRRFEEDFPKINFKDIQKIVEYLSPTVESLLVEARIDELESLAIGRTPTVQAQVIKDRIAQLTKEGEK